MLRPAFLLQPLTAAILIACYSASTLAEDSTQPTMSMHSESVSLAPIVATAQQGNDANGLIVRADPKQPTQPIPSADGADYLQSIIGFNQVQSGGANGDVTFRGMFGSRIKILTDGSENLGACPSRMDAPTSYISPESYDKISVIKGPQTVQYANTGSAATVIFEREPESLTTDKPYRGQASVMLGSFGRVDQNLEAAVGDEKKYLRLNTNRSSSNSYVDGSHQQVPSAWERWNADLAVGWMPNPDTWFELNGGKSDGEALYAGRAMDGSAFKRESLGLKFRKQHINDVIQQIEGQVNYSFNDHVMDNFSLRPFNPNDGMKMPMATNVSRRTLNARVAMTSEWDKLQLISGVDTQHNEHATRSGMNNSYVQQPRSSDMKFESYGAFSELSYPINDQYKWVAGARVDQVHVKDLRQDSHVAGLNTVLDKTLPSGFFRFENQHPHHDAKTYIGVGFVERMPDYWELFSPKQGNAGSINTFNGVDTEKTLQLDLGYQHHHGAFSSWASAYVGMVKDYILMRYQSPAMSMDTTMPMNSMTSMHQTMNQAMPMNTMSGGMQMGSAKSAYAKNVDATIAGAEFGLAYEFTPYLQADVSGMYAWGRNTTNNTPLPQIAPFEGRMNLRYVQDKYNVGLLWRVVASQNRVSLNEGNIVGYDMKKSAGFTTLALNGTYTLKDGVDLSIGIDNLLGKTYTEHLNRSGSSGFGFAAEEQFNNVGRNYWGRLSVKF
ncbi:TonB-dependent copper receptor [Acinetobacter sp. 187]|nr:TonB-dependent copper receptor [Acinetobacter lanii]NHC04206.1 TonB-dependent copper receptor [Acinetobacter lanii]